MKLKLTIALLAILALNAGQAGLGLSILAEDANSQPALISLKSQSFLPVVRRESSGLAVNPSPNPTPTGTPAPTATAGPTPVPGAVPAATPTSTATPTPMGSPLPTTTGTPTTIGTPLPTTVGTPTTISTPPPATTPTPTPIGMPTPTTTVTPGVQAASRPSLTPYGVNEWNFTDEAMLAMKELGTTWMRFLVNWRRIEVTPGAPVWNTGANDNIDYYIRQAQKYGIQVSVAPYNPPDWARPGDSRLPYPQAYADFVATLVDRYKGKIAAVEVLNEENTGTLDNRNRDALLYVSILQVGYQAVKGVSPDTIVTTSGLWGSPEGYLEDLYTLGAGGYFDVVNFHYYPGSSSPAVNYSWLISHLRKVMERYGDGGKPIWLTEFGWNINDEQQAAANIVSPQAQSDYMRYVLDASMKSGFVEKVFWFDLRNDDGMALMHSTDNYSWLTAQPGLVSNIGPVLTTLSVNGDWTTRWPRYGTLIVDGEQMSYGSLALSGGNTMAQGLVRGVNGTAKASHFAGTTVYNRDETRNFKRQAYYTYADFIKANPTWTMSDTAPLPNLPPTASSPIQVVNPGFENGTTRWAGALTIDTTQYHSGMASAKITNTTGTQQRASQGSLAVEPGRSYFLRAWVKIAPGGGGNMDVMVKVDLQSSSGSFVAVTPQNYHVFDTRGDWREVHFPFRTPDNVTQIAVLLNTDGGTGTAWFDDISVEAYALE